MRLAGGCVPCLWLAHFSFAIAIVSLGFVWAGVVGLVALLLWITAVFCTAPWNYEYIPKYKLESTSRVPRRTFYLPNGQRVVRPNLIPIYFALAIGLVLTLLQFWFYLWARGDQGLFTSAACGASSCSRAQNQATWAYNPRGYFPDSQGQNNVSSLEYVYCPCGTPGPNGLQLSCAWADSNGLPIFGYPDGNTSAPPIANGGLATADPANYPNLALGVLMGLFIGSTVQPTGFCPGVENHLNSKAIYGRGKSVCAKCFNYFRSKYIWDPNSNADCPPSLYDNVPDGSCYLCPAPTTCSQLGVVDGLIAGMVIAMLLGCMCTVCY